MLGRRAEAMGRRLKRTAERMGVPASGVARIGAAYRLTAEHRAARIPDEHHPFALHHARTALILMDDVGLADATALAAAMFLDTLRPELVPPPEQWVDRYPAEAAIVARVPGPDAGEGLLEDLLAAEPSAMFLALAERLDHARHLHMGAAPREAWPALHRTTCQVYRPVAERAHELLGRRFSRWCGAFERRFLDRFLER